MIVNGRCEVLKMLEQDVLTEDCEKARDKTLAFVIGRTVVFGAS
jgi:hypothetical protein